MNRRLVGSWLSLFMILIGCSILLYPTAKNYYFDMKQQKLVEQYVETIQQLQVVDEEDELNEEIALEVDTNEAEEQEINLPIEAMLEIKKIDLRIPVIKGATMEHLNVSVASLDHTGKPWLGNNYVIAGHRSRTFGRHFNRLSELEINDEMVITDTENNQYVYKVTEVKIIDEKEVSVLKSRDKSELTLITCEPMNVKNPPTRLIVKGTQINQ